MRKKRVLEQKRLARAASAEPPAVEARFKNHLTVCTLTCTSFTGCGGGGTPSSSMPSTTSSLPVAVDVKLFYFRVVVCGRWGGGIRWMRNRSTCEPSPPFQLASVANRLTSAAAPRRRGSPELVRFGGGGGDEASMQLRMEWRSEGVKCGARSKARAVIKKIQLPPSHLHAGVADYALAVERDGRRQRFDRPLVPGDWCGVGGGRAEKTERLGRASAQGTCFIF